MGWQSVTPYSEGEQKVLNRVLDAVRRYEERNIMTPRCLVLPVSTVLGLGGTAFDEDGSVLTTRVGFIMSVPVHVDRTVPGIVCTPHSFVTWRSIRAEQRRKRQREELATIAGTYQLPLHQRVVLEQMRQAAQDPDYRLRIRQRDEARATHLAAAVARDQ